jgi:hypothetical protein
MAVALATSGADAHTLGRARHAIADEHVGRLVRVTRDEVVGK